MNTAEVLALYDETMRRDPPPLEGLSSRWVGPVLRTSGVYNLIEYADLDADNADAAIEGEIAHFRALGRPFEWKVFGHDGVKDLPARLAAHGLDPGEEETFLAYDLARPLPPSSRPAPAGVSVRPIANEAEVADLSAVVVAAFGEEMPEQTEAVRRNIGKGAFSMFIAYAGDGRPIGSGRLDTPKDKPFCGLYTGGVVPVARGAGVYRALVEARMKAASECGYRYAVVEAGTMSLPILTRLGFQPLTTTRPFEFRP